MQSNRSLRTSPLSWTPSRSRPTSSATRTARPWRSAQPRSPATSAASSLYEPAPGVTQEAPEFLARLDALLAEDQREQLLSVFLAEAGLDPDALEQLRASPVWPGRVAAAHTIARELRAEESYQPDPEALSSHSIPVLLLLGSESPEWAKKGTALVQSLLPDSRVAVLEGEGHIAILTAPQLVADQVARFLGETGARRPDAGAGLTRIRHARVRAGCAPTTDAEVGHQTAARGGGRVRPSTTRPALIGAALAVATSTALAAGASTPIVCGSNGCTPLPTSTLQGLLTLPEALQPADPPPAQPFLLFRVDDLDGATHQVVYVPRDSGALLGFTD